MGAASPPSEHTAAGTGGSASLFRKRFRKFRTLKRGWFSFVALASAFLLSFFNPVLINDRALVVRYQGATYFPAFAGHYEAIDFGQRRIGEANYRDLKAEFAEKGEGNWVILPPYPYHPNESLLRDPHLPGAPPHAPDARHWMGTDDRGRDVFARLVYGFRISILFAVGVVGGSYTIGITIGSVLGFFGGRIDIIGQRLTEIWAGLPFLYTLIIVSSIIRPNLLALVGLLMLFQWVNIAYYIRGEFYREKAKDYVSAAIAIGEPDVAIMFRHILPNALTPIITFAPFAIVGSIVSLVALDFLGFGLQPPTPSWGELVGQGKANMHAWHLVIFPLGALFVTLLMVVFIGEALREAFDPKVTSRLR